MEFVFFKKLGCVEMLVENIIYFRLFIGFFLWLVLVGFLVLFDIFFFFIVIILIVRIWFNDNEL